MRLPILAGPLRGRWWLAGSRGKLLRVLGGTYEPEQTALFQQHVRSGMTVLDIGAHVGFYTLLAGSLVRSDGEVWSFEPDPRNARFLDRHVAINRLDNVRVQRVAISDAPGTARFGGGTGTGTRRLTEAGEIEVRTVTVDGFCAEHEVEPDVMKIDVEGAEAGVLRGAATTLRRHRPVLFLSTHGTAVHQSCLALLQEAGYGVEPILGDDITTTTELLCLPGDG